MLKVIPTGRFDDLLPNPQDPDKAELRSRIIYVLNTRGEILPPAESPLGKLWKLINSPDCSLEECEDLIELDPILTARIFRMANSAAYGGTAINISEAIFHLGFKRLRELAFSAGVFSRFSGMDLPPRWERFWLRNIFIALLCEKVASHYFSTDGTEYLSGLLHDVGWLFLAAYLPNEVNKIIGFPTSIIEAERQILPFSHADISGAIAARSGFPQRSVHAIFQHEQTAFVPVECLPDPGESARFLGAILSVCDLAANSSQLELFEQSQCTLEALKTSSQMLWISKFYPPLDLEPMIATELDHASELFKIYFE